VSGGGGGRGSTWKICLAVGTALCGAGYALEHTHGAPLVVALLLAAGGLSVIFGSCEAMILSVEGLGERMRWNPFVAGTMAGLASNVPEIIMLAFVVAKEPRVAFVVACLTLHVNSLVFGIYSGLLPRDATGHARLPDAIVKLGTDLLGCAAGIFLALGMLMLCLRAFKAGDHGGEGLGINDLWALGIGLLVVQIVSVRELIRNFAAGEPADPHHEPVALMSKGQILLYGTIGILFSFLGGHAVGDFADTLVRTLTARHYSEMIGAIVVSFFAGVGSYLMTATAHAKGKYDLALSNVTGAITQMPFVILPATLILMAIFAQLGVIPMLKEGGVLAIDLETTSVVLFGFPTLLILWKSVADDGKVNQLETTVMVVMFALIIYLLAQHG
jgi:Ca2+/Na+ antiporter